MGEDEGQANGLLRLVMVLAGAVVAAIASVGFVAFVGGVILWSRFEAAQLPADQAVALQPREELVTVGAIALVLFVLGGLVAVLLLRLLDRQGEASLRTRTGLLLILGLEVLAAFLIEGLDSDEDAVALAAAVGGWVALVFLVEQAAWWYEHNQRSPYAALARRMRIVFVRGDPAVSRLRLWIGLAALTVATVFVVTVEPRPERYIAATAILAGTAWYLRPRGAGPERTWGGVLLASGLLVVAASALARENDWVAEVAGVAVALMLVNLSVAKATDRGFLLYGVVVFASVMVFGAAFNFLRALEDPQGQGLALLRTNDADPICGLYVGETEDRLYYARIDLQGGADDRRLLNDRGRLLWAPRDRITASAIGPLESTRKAHDTALRLRNELALDSEPLTRGGPVRTELPAQAPRRSDGSDPCAAATTPAALLLTPERRLAQQFQPRLLLAADDGFWPVSVLTLFDLERRGRTLCRRPLCVRVVSPADVPFTGGETEWLEYPAKDTSTRQQRADMIEALGTSDPYRSAKQYFLLSGGGAGATTTLQYWYFYVFNYQPLKRVGLSAGYHEGDFEHVGVLLSSARRPRAVWMARHDDEGQVFLWDEPALRRRGEHVDVYVSKGSHASYESCTEKERRKAPFGFINDRPECRGTHQLVLEPGQSPLLNLAQARWGCWAGRFGHTRPGISAFEFELVEANGPRSPLWQQAYGGVRHTPCAGIETPQPLASEGEEPLDAVHASRIAGRAGRLDPLVDQCSDWQRAQAQGAYVVACRAEELAAWVRGGLEGYAGPSLSVLMSGEPPPRDAEPRPIAVRRDATRPSFRGWRIASGAEAPVDVYASCLIGNRPVEATFEDVRFRRGDQLQISDASPGEWHILRGADTVATAVPVLADEARSGPQAARRSPGQDTRCR